MAKNNSLNNSSSPFTIDPSAASDSYIQFDESTTAKWRHGNDATDDSFRLSQGNALGTNDTFIMTTAGERTMPLQPAFLGSLSSQDDNVTGDSTSFTLGSGNVLTEIFDQGGDFVTTGTFTAPVTGKYFLEAQFKLGGLVAANTFAVMNIRTSAQVFPGAQINAGGARTLIAAPGVLNMYLSVFANMTAGDTATTDISVHGGSKVTDILTTGATNSFFAGFLAC